eukprot:324211-Prorocentrum_minimum.AAC.1
MRGDSDRASCARTSCSLTRNGSPRILTVRPRVTPSGGAPPLPPGPLCAMGACVRTTPPTTPADPPNLPRGEGAREG